ncbi:Doublecortin domain-containing protein 2C [Apodemus speciosus]|uniref:Doublecortin domain-containing protein 2C n=1 Tax=Apodemus speciosus TaxID=105296 RepID=A0ABQ0FDM4_APOSI
MGTRGPYALVDTTPAKTILVYRNGDQFYVGRKFVFSRRRVANFEALLEQLTEQVEVPFGVRRLYTPTFGHPVLGLDSLQTGGKYVAAGRERFKKLDYIHIVPRKPSKMRKLKEIKPVVHCDINVPSRWQTQSRTSRYINVFTNGRLFIPPIKIIIPKFSLSDWNSVLAMIGEKVFPLGGVRKLFTMDGHLLDDSKNLQDNHFYVAAGLESFKSIPYWRSSRVPNEVQQRFGSNDKYTQTKKRSGQMMISKEGKVNQCHSIISEGQYQQSPRKTSKAWQVVESKVKEPLQNDSVPPKSQDSVYYAKEKKQMDTEPFIQSGAEGDVYKAQTPAKETQEALEVKEDPEVKVEVPVDQAPAEIVKEIDEIGDSSPGLESGMEKEKRYKTMIRTATWCKGERVLSLQPKELIVALDLLSRAYVDTGQLQGPHVFIASLKSFCKNKEVVPTPVEAEVQRDPSMGQESLEESSLTQDQRHEQQESFVKSSLGTPSPEQRPEKKESPRQSSLGLIPPEHQLEQQELHIQSFLALPSQEQQPEQQEISVQSFLGLPSPEQQLEQHEVSVQSSLEPSSSEQQLEQQEMLVQSSLGPPSPEQQLEQHEVSVQSSLEPSSPEQQLEQESPGKLFLGPSSPEQQLEWQEIPAYSSLGPPSPEQQFERESSKESSLGQFLEQPPEQ